MQLEVIDDLDRLQKLRPEWERLTQTVEVNTDFYTTWVFVWEFITLTNPTQWFVVAMREHQSGDLVAVFPLQRFNIRGSHRTYSAVHPLATTIASYIEFPIKRPALKPAIDTLLAKVLGQELKIDVACFWPIHEGSLLHTHLLERYLPSKQLVAFSFAKNLNELDTRGLSYEDYANASSTTTFKNAMYCERRLGSLGTLEIEIVEDAERCAAMTFALCEKAKKVYGDELVYRHTPEWSELYRNLASQLTQRGSVEFWNLRFDQAVIASALCFYHKGRRHYAFVDYDRVYAKHSPGKILLRHIFKKTFDDKAVLCLGLGNHDYKKVWIQNDGDLKAAYVLLNADTVQTLSPELKPQIVNIHALIR